MEKEEKTKKISRELPSILSKDEGKKIGSSLKFVTLVRCVYALMVLLYCLVWVFSGSHQAQDTYNNLLSVAVIEIFVFTVISSVALMRNRFVRTVTYVGMLNDTLLAAYIVMFTGYITSPFLYLFLIIPLYGGIILRKKGGIAGASIVTIVLILLQFILGYVFSHLIPNDIQPTIEPLLIGNTEALSRFIPIIGVAFGVGLLSGQLSSMYVRTEQRLVESRNEFKHLRGVFSKMLDALPIGVVIVNKITNDVLYTNPSVTEFLGDLEEQNFQNMLEDGQIQLYKSQESTIIHHHDKYLQVVSFPFSLQQGDNLAGYHVTDITRQKLAELERSHRQRLELLGEFSTKVAHEIRNPLACISGCNEMLQVDAKDEDQNQIHDMMSHEINRLNRLLGDILVFARSPKISPQQLHLKPLLDHQKSLFLSGAEYAKMIIELDISDDATLFADETSLIQIVMTLWKNSAEATKNEGTIRVSVEEEPMQIHFMDDGPGISEDQESRIFEPFYTTKENGTGLGLATARQLALDNGLQLRWDRGLKCFELMPLPVNEGAVAPYAAIAP